MKVNTLRAKLADQNRVVIGTFVFGPDPAIPEILGRIGYDFIIIDMEHSPNDWQQVAHLIRAGEIGGATPVVRVSSMRRDDIQRALDLGAAGILVPHISSLDQAKEFADIIRYPPVGSRGCCSSVRATAFSLDEWAEHKRRSNEHVLGMILIEDAGGLEVAREIGQLDGIDVALVGRVDLGTALGFDWRDDEKLTPIVNKVIRDIRDGGRHAAYVVYDTKSAQEWVDKGCRVIVFSQDYKVFVNGYKTALEELPKIVKAVG